MHHHKIHFTDCRNRARSNRISIHRTYSHIWMHMCQVITPPYLWSQWNRRLISIDVVVTKFLVHECVSILEIQQLINTDRLKKKSQQTADSSCEGRVYLHFTQSGLSISTAPGVVVERGSEYILAHTGPRELDGHPLGGCGSGFALVPGYTTLTVRVRANM